jgi:predicted Rossmann fold nucleotide-binding protein DprA/Smf involved in DNA uptake
VDEAAMRGALDVGGAAVGVLANNLLRATTAAAHREHLLGGTLALFSPYQPEAAFSVGNAMGRNRYIYCLADAAVAVHSGTKGGTWSGASENLKRRWVPLWVRGGQNAPEGNRGLEKLGARALDTEPRHLDVRELLLDPRTEPTVRETPPKLRAASAGIDAEPSRRDAEAELRPLYDHFLTHLQALCRPPGVSRDDLGTALDLARSQLDRWLKRALAEGRIRRTTGPVRYEWLEADSAQLGLFDGGPERRRCGPGRPGVVPSSPETGASGRPARRATE